MRSLLEQLKVPVLTVFIALLTFFLLTKLFGPIPFAVNSVQTTKTDLFTVEGTGEAAGVPETAQFTVGVTKTASTVEAAQDQTNQAINKITEELKAIGINEKNIKTSNYNVNPNIDFSNGRQTTTGYTVNATMEVKLEDASLANRAVDVATANGANIINNVSFTLTDEDKEELEQKARAEAIKDAKEKAQQISEEVGIKLGRIISVSVTPVNEPPVFDRVALESEPRGGAPTQLQPGENTVRVNVNLSYETL